MKPKQYIYLCFSYYLNKAGNYVGFFHKAYKKEASAKAFCTRNPTATYKTIQLI